MENRVELVLRGLLVVERVRAALGDEPGRDVERKEILELEVARAVEESGSGKINSADSPQTNGEDNALGAQTAWSEPGHGGGKPGGGWPLGSVVHGTGSAFLSASSSACAE